MPITLLLALGTYGVRFWSTQGKNFCLQAECPNVTRLEKEKFLTFIKGYVQSGRFPINKEKFRPLGDGLFEIKPSSQLRVIGFFHGGDFIIIDCRRKKSDQLSQDVRDTLKQRLQSCRKELKK